MLDLFPADLIGWTNVQCVQPDGTGSSTPLDRSVVSGANRIALDSSRFASGTQSLRFDAPPTGPQVSKAAIAKEGVDFRPGDRVTARFDLYLEDNGSAENVFLMDLESTELSGYPGRRLTISRAQELILESKNSGGAYGAGPGFQQLASSRVPMPKGKWVSVRVELVLSREDRGSAKIWQDGVLVLSDSGKTFPSESEITHYDWIEYGLTANSSAVAQTLWMDDIAISRD